MSISPDAARALIEKIERTENEIERDAYVHGRTVERIAKQCVRLTLGKAPCFQCSGGRDHRDQPCFWCEGRAYRL